MTNSDELPGDPNGVPSAEEISGYYNSGFFDPMHKLVLLRHGESDWNRENRFTGWTDVDLSAKGSRRPRGRPAAARPRALLSTWPTPRCCKRAIRTLWLALEELDQLWIPVSKTGG